MIALCIFLLGLLLPATLAKILRGSYSRRVARAAHVGQETTGLTTPMRAALDEPFDSDLVWNALDDFQLSRYLSQSE